MSAPSTQPACRSAIVNVASTVSAMEARPGLFEGRACRAGGVRPTALRPLPNRGTAGSRRSARRSRAPLSTIQRMSRVLRFGILSALGGDVRTLPATQVGDLRREPRVEMGLRVSPLRCEQVAEHGDHVTADQILAAPFARLNHDAGVEVTAAVVTSGGGEICSRLGERWGSSRGDAGPEGFG